MRDEPSPSGSPGASGREQSLARTRLSSSSSSRPWHQPVKKEGFVNPSALGDETGCAQELPQGSISTRRSFHHPSAAQGMLLLAISSPGTGQLSGTAAWQGWCVAGGKGDLLLWVQVLGWELGSRAHERPPRHEGWALKHIPGANAFSALASSPRAHGSCRGSPPSQDTGRETRLLTQLSEQAVTHFHPPISARALPPHHCHSTWGCTTPKQSIPPMSNSFLWLLSLPQV